MWGQESPDHFAPSIVSVFQIRVYSPWILQYKGWGKQWYFLFFYFFWGGNTIFFFLSSAKKKKEKPEGNPQTNGTEEIMSNQVTLNCYKWQWGLWHTNPCQWFQEHHCKQRSEFFPNEEGYVVTQVYHSSTKSPIQRGGQCHWIALKIKLFHWR